MIRLICLLIVATLMIVSCDEVKDEQKLHIYGNPEIVEKTVNGETVYDTVAHTTDYFRLIDQDSAVITPEALSNKVYVADFFFTSCISICPKMSTQMLRVYNAYEDQDSLALISFSIDPEYDDVEVLKSYADKLGVSSKTWHFLTGDKDEIYGLARSYLTERPADDPDDEANILHSGAFVLVDTQKRIRGVYDGTVPEQVDLLIKDIKKLLKEENASDT
ncbi:MAG: SCO family protein [Cyclobacteriaceae bacterium]